MHLVFDTGIRKICTLFDSPVSHSISPFLFNSFLSEGEGTVHVYMEEIFLRTNLLNNFSIFLEYRTLLTVFMQPLNEL